jgi:hypothetical protein
MSKANGFLAVRIAVALCAVLTVLLWAAGQYPGGGGRAVPGSASPRTLRALAPAGLKDYLVVWNGSSNVWLAGDSGAAAGVVSIDAGHSHGVALHADGSITRIGIDPETATVTEQRFPDADAASIKPGAAAGGRAGHCLALNGDGTVTAWGDDGYGQCRVPAGLSSVTAVAAGGLHSVALKSDGTVACWGLLRAAPPYLTNVVAVGASEFDACALTAGGTVAVWGRGCLFGARLTAQTPGACEILEAGIAGCGVYMAVVRAKAGLLEGDADGDGVPAVEEVFLLGTDPLARDADVYAPELAAAAPALESESVAAKGMRGLGGAGASVSLLSFENGTTYHADASKADDGGDGLSWETAKRTIQAAVDAAQPGDTVLVTNGVYGEGSRVTPGGQFQNRLVITNGVLVRSVSGAGLTVIQGSGPDTFDTGAAVRCVYISDGVIDGFTLEGGAAVAHWTSSDERDKSGGCLNMIEATAESEVRSCIIAGGTAYDGGGSRGGRLVNSVIHSSSACYGGGAYRADLRNCTVSGNGAWYYGGAAFYCGVTNSIASGNGEYWNGEYWENDPCCGSEVGYSCAAPLPEGAGNIVADPLFADPANGDYSLQSGSPCIDAGSGACVTADTDLAGNPRIQGAAVDMGAYEFLADTDGDGVPDNLDADDDNDGVNDDAEVERGTDPLDPASRNRIVYADSDIGSDAYDGYAPSVGAGVSGPKATVRQAVGLVVSGDVIELRGAAAFADQVFSVGDKDVLLRPVGSVRF